MSNQYQPKEAGPLMGDEWQEALEIVPMLQEAQAPPVGAQRTLSPILFYTMTSEERLDVSGLGEDFGLYEEPCPTIDKRGVERFNRFYTNPHIQQYTTGDKRLPQRDLVIRYDRALAARGVLEEMQLLERDEQGRYVPLMILVPQEVAKQRWSRDEIVRLRSAYINANLKKRAGAERSYTMLQRGIELMDRLLDDTLARERQQRRRREAPRPAAPIEDAYGLADTRGEIATALEQASSWAEVNVSSTVSKSKDDEVRTRGLAQALGGKASSAGMGEAEPTNDSQPTGNDWALGEALGGTIGFRRQTTSRLGSGELDTLRSGIHGEDEAD